MDVLFLIPARGGSKGLPGKNLALVGGIPMVGRAARTARAAAVVLDGRHRVVCSTDDTAIAAAARAWGAEVPFERPTQLATDGARTSDVVVHALGVLGGDYDCVVLMQPTSPLTELEDVLSAVELHRRSGQPVVSVCVAEHPAQWLYSMGDQGELRRLVIQSQPAHQRQQAPVAYRPNGAIYAASVESFAKDPTFYTPQTRGFVMPPDRSVDVDTSHQLAEARRILAERPVPAISIGPRLLGAGHPCFLIAEAGVNHNGDLDTAKALVDAAVSAGADAVKFQTFRAERLVTRQAPKAEYQIQTTGAQDSQFDMIKRLELSEAAHHALQAHCLDRNIMFLSSPFDEESCDLLVDLGVAALKIPSGEITNLPFLRHAARKGLPLIVSTGMSALDEVARAVEVLRAEGCAQLALLHCVSNYPADPADANLRAMATLREAFGTPVGFSDHTEGDAVPLAAVALGACVVEKHFTLDRLQPGPDHRASIEPSAFAALAAAVRRVEAALGDGTKRPAVSEAGTARVARKSLVALRDIARGERIDDCMIGARRPGTGMPPGSLPLVLGRLAKTAIAEGTLLAPEMLE